MQSPSPWYWSWFSVFKPWRLEFISPEKGNGSRHVDTGVRACSHALHWYCCSVTQSCLTLCDPRDYSKSGSPVPHHLLKFAQVHVHCIGDAIQPSHPLTSSSPSALSLSQISIRDFSNESAVRVRWPKYRSFSFSSSPSNEYSGMISLKID